MEPVHIVTNKDNIAPIVLMPGDPLRAKYIAEKYLTDAKLINTVRNMFGYTGFYKNTRITVMASGMGMPSMGIYAYELIHFYGVKRIIRIGSAGSNNMDVKVRDLVVATSARTLSTFGIAWNNDESDTKYATTSLIDKFKSVAGNNVHFGPIITSDTFDVYTGIDHVLKRLSFEDALATEMETFALYHIGAVEGVEVASILTVVDSRYEKDVIVTSEERQSSLDEMIELALEVLIK